MDKYTRSCWTHNVMLGGALPNYIFSALCMIDLLDLSGTKSVYYYIHLYCMFLVIWVVLKYAWTVNSKLTKKTVVANLLQSASFGINNIKNRIWLAWKCVLDVEVILDANKIHPMRLGTILKKDNKELDYYVVIIRYFC